VISFTNNTSGIKFNDTTNIYGIDSSLTVTNNKLGVSSIIAGSTTVNSITNIPVTHSAVLATTNASGALSFAALPSDGYNVHVILYNSSASDISITLPSTGNYVCTSSNNVEVKAGGYAEINILSIVGKGYIKAVGVEEKN